MFVQLHSEWYEKVGVKNIKKVPLNIKELLKPVGLAHWIMGDGFWNGKTVIICTDNFTYEEVVLLADTITENFNLIVKVIKRTSDNGNKRWRLRFSQRSIEKLREIVVPYFIPEMLYKLNLS